MSSNQFNWLCCNKNKERRHILENVLPSGYKYKISSFKIVEDSAIGNETKFETVMNVNICNEEGINQFLAEFEVSSLTIYNIFRGDLKGTKKALFPGIESVTIMSEKGKNPEARILKKWHPHKHLENRPNVQQVFTLS